MTKPAGTTSTSALIEQVVGRMIARRTDMAHKSASQQSPDSVTNMEESDPQQKVTQKLRHTGEDYDKANMTSYGLQQTRDLVGQGPNTGPLPDKASSDQPDDRSSLNDTKSNPLYDVFDSVGEPTQDVDDPGTQGEPVSEKLQLKKDASALLTRMDDVNRQGQEIIDYLMAQTVGQKSADAAVRAPVYTQEQLLSESAKLATADAMTQVKTAMLHVADDAIYAAEATALEIQRILSETPSKQGSADTPNDHSSGLTLPSSNPSPPKQASGGPLPPEPAPAPGGDLGGEQAMDAMTGPAPAGDPGGEPPISEEEAQALMARSLQENGIEPAGLGGEGDEPADGAGADISPEDLALFEQVMQQAGVSQEEVAEAMRELEAEMGAGITPEQGMIADEEAAKTGHYKFASFINRPVAKTAEQEQRAAMVRGAVRDFIFGPSTRNFN